MRVNLATVKATLLPGKYPFPLISQSIWELGLKENKGASAFPICFKPG